MEVSGIPEYIRGQRGSNLRGRGGRRKMRIILAALSFWLAASAIDTASAEVVYPWCAYYGGKTGGTNCGFSTFQQCLAAIAGNGGNCSSNPRYGAGGAAPRRRRYD